MSDIMKDVASTFSKRIHELREVHGLRKDQTAVGSGMTEMSLNRYEKGLPPNLKNAIKLARYFNVSVDYLIGLSNVKEIQNDDRV
jgi:transcriptional regulator with XRE-family HTH domain